MAAKPTFSKEQLNFFKFSTLVLDEFPKVLRQIFITKWDSKVAIRPGFIVWDDSSLVRNMLLTSEGGKTIIPTTKSIEEWDCTALFKATIYAKTFGVPGSTLNDLYLKKSKPAPGSFHSSVQSSTGNQDETYALAIDQLRLLRNTLCHSPKSEIVKRDFDNYVKLVNDALTAVNVDTAFVDVIGKMSEDDFPTEKVKELEECLARELRAIIMFHENMEQTLSSVKECGEKTYQYTEEIHTMVKREHGNRRNEEQQPTRSCLPEKLPKKMFTARNAEMQKVVSSLKDEEMAIASIFGGPGFGKTAIAVEVSHALSNDHNIPVVFSDVSRATTVDEIILLLCRDVGIYHDDDPKSSLHFWLKNIKEKVIFVLDDIDNLLLEKTDDFYNFICLLRKNSNQHCQIVTTSRTSYTIPELSTAKVQVNEMDDEACVELLRKNCPKQDDSFLLKLAKLCGYIPLAMCIAGSRLDDFKHCNELLQHLEKQPMKTLECPERNQYVSRAINMSYEMLNDEKKEIFVRLAVFEGSFSEDAAREVVEKDDLDTKRILKNLVSRNLIKQPTKHRYSIHLLIKHFLNVQAESEEKREDKARAEVLMIGYYLKLGNALTIKSYSKDGYKASRVALMKEAHNIQNVLKICCQQDDPSSEISNFLVESEIYITSSKYVSLFVRTIIPGSTVDQFLQWCSKLAEEREQHAIKINFDCLLAEQERIKSIGNCDELFKCKMDAINKEFEVHHEEVKEDKSICAHYYSLYGRYLLCKSRKDQDEERLDSLNDARKQLENSLNLSAELTDTSVRKADKVFLLLQLGNVWKKTACCQRFLKCEEAYEESTGIARKYFEEAIQLSKSSLGEHDLTSACYKNLGDHLFAAKNYKEAEENYNIAKETQENLGLNASRSHVFLLNNLGKCLTLTNRSKEAIEILENARDMAEKLAEGDDQNVSLNKLYPSLAIAYHSVQSEKALDYAKKALTQTMSKSDFKEIKHIIQSTKTPNTYLIIVSSIVVVIIIAYIIQILIK